MTDDDFQHFVSVKMQETVDALERIAVALEDIRG